MLLAKTSCVSAGHHTFRDGALISRRRPSQLSRSPILRYWSIKRLDLTQY